MHEQKDPFWFQILRLWISKKWSRKVNKEICFPFIQRGTTQSKSEIQEARNIRKPQENFKDL